MLSFLIGFFTVLLVLLSGMIVILVLMQRASANSGMGASLGGGAAESAFGAESGNILTRWTIYFMVAFFVLCFGLYLAHMANMQNNTSGPLLPEFAIEEHLDKTAPGTLTALPESTATETQATEK
ncbi:MAG: preprotein translocase subunit SecG [Verrucomicrobia bacterium CG_4_10_14_3_um_filter_43_23]|nr:MAG: preprotein translocase subunit SecG [Verrucomicrobia bacterium CG1_02_43_26]PIP60064.1 MAG: preprotein translocase subunit SecG [Verrucomicrobia bacterium CG22_combo_CG10-13_8_21_14_all_43_17]PIX58689.1 MAG: preprotein translocase subunit SecG [Verrucomicrobia bacterium CG_4_10_14_3_um_filter_43_23]PIY62638.1 MAG: preprotein translocase subunit SecG [Verrucomicrobia bacterium CG_4_10_14_0_8_um_filter_43_34]PJA43289.1 MAG: preprotein translocase subunit SecG [Verrucomicrobia bacterium CG